MRNLSLAEQMAVIEFGYYPKPYEKEWKAFDKCLKEKRAELSINWESTYLAASFNNCKGKSYRKNKTRVSSKEQFLFQY